MAVSLKFLDINNKEINISDGLDFGTCKAGKDTLIKFKIKNEGDRIAKELTISSEPLNTVEEVGEEEYKRQLEASKWKGFSVDNGKTYSNVLLLGDLQNGKFVEGIKEITVDFASQEASNWIDVWQNGVTKFVDNKHVFSKPNDVHEGIMGKRMKYKNIEIARDLEIEMCLDFKITTVAQSPTLGFISIPCRINSNGDGKGYLFMLRHRRDDKKFKINIYKDAKGMTSYEDRDYGISIFETTEWIALESNKKISFKIYNNSKNQPTFEIKYNNKNIKIGKTGDIAVNDYIVSDTSSKSYRNPGNFYWETSLYDGDYSVSTYNMAIKTEELEQPIYIKTNIDPNSINKTKYLTSTTITYVES